MNDERLKGIKILNNKITKITIFYCLFLLIILNMNKQNAQNTLNYQKKQVTKLTKPINRTQSSVKQQDNSLDYGENINNHMRNKVLNKNSSMTKIKNTNTSLISDYNKPIVLVINSDTLSNTIKSPSFIIDKNESKSKNIIFPRHKEVEKISNVNKKFINKQLSDNNYSDLSRNKLTKYNSTANLNQNLKKNISKSPLRSTPRASNASSLISSSIINSSKIDKKVNIINNIITQLSLLREMITDESQNQESKSNLYLDQISYNFIEFSKEILNISNKQPNQSKSYL